jgi:trans-aconitate 2-methyltransferase
MTWNPAQYLKFAQPRLRPALDLLNRIELDAPEFVCDLGCGTGSVTRLLATRWSGTRVTGVDASAAMLERARAEGPGLEWVQADVGRWTPATPPHLIYSNAALHWLDDHAALFARLFGQLAAGGVFAVQMPRNFHAPSHTLFAEAVRGGPWRRRLEPLLRPNPVAEPAWYFDLLAPRAAAVDIWETEYLHVLSGADAVLEWTRGTSLVPYLAALQGPERDAFEATYAGLVRAAYPPCADGRTLFPFRRLFIVASKA